MGLSTMLMERKVHARNAKGFPICGAKTKNGKYPICQKAPVSDNGRCQNHGGTNPGPPIIHGRRASKGRYTRILEGSNLAALYETAIQSTNLLDLKETAALLETVLQRVTQRATKFDSIEFRKVALDMFNEWHDLESTDPDEARTKLLELGEWLKSGVSEDRALDRVAEHADRLAKRIEGAWQIKLQKQQVVNAHDLRLLFAFWIDVLKEQTSPEIAATVAMRVQSEMARRARENKLETKQTQLQSAIDTNPDGTDPSV
jgi:ATP-dependent Lon protease